MEKKRIFLLVLSALFLISIIMFTLKFSENNLGMVGFTIYDSQPTAEGNDTYIKEGSNTNYGTQTTLMLGKTAGAASFRSLIHFDVSSIPSGNTITSAILQLYVSATTSNQSINVKVYRVTAQWDELEAGWNNRTYSDLWGTAGGDYAEEVSSASITNESGKAYNLTVINAVKGWVNGTYSNYGLILIATNAENGNYIDIASSDYADSTKAPRLTVDYTANAVPTILNLSATSSPIAPKQIGESVSFSVNWMDLESNPAQAFFCNSSSITTSGCQGKTFCSTSLAQTNPITCSYTVTNSENRTQQFYVSVCDAGNCSEANSSYFYVNHAPNITLIQPNGGEIVNQSAGNYLIKFNVSDSDADSLTASIYYGLTQNSTTNIIDSNINLSNYCASGSTVARRNCSYSWNSTGIYGAYFLTIILNDSFITSTDSSDSSFNIRSLIDLIAPRMLANWLDSGIYSGKLTGIFANISEEYIQSVWASFNFSQTNITMRNTTSAETYNATFIAPAPGNYRYLISAIDTTGNLNSTDWQDFSVAKPNASSQNDFSSLTALPYSTIKITSKLNSTENLRDVYAYLNVPSGFTFLSAYPQNSYLGNFSAETKTATWYLSVPITESTYPLNVTYTDYYSNSWNSSNMQITVSSSVGGGGYSLSISGYPEVETGQDYYAEAHFKSSGTAATPDSIKITLYNPAGAKIVDSVSMAEKETGTYNYSYPVPGSGATEGQWETRLNATKSSISYYSNQFWKLVGGVFDVRNIVINDNTVPSLSISVVLENTGGADKDMFLSWNLTIESNQTYLISGLDTVRVSAYSNKTHTITPSTDYVGQVRITFIGEYSAGEKAGAYKVFSTISGNISCGDSVCSSGESCSSCPGDCGVCPSTPSGGGGGGGSTVKVENKTADITIKADNEINLAKNMEKIIYVEVENTGDKELTNISLELETLDKTYYSASPISINSIKPGEKRTFDVKLKISDFIGEKEFFYLVKTNEMQIREPGKIIVKSLRDYFLTEIENLKSRLSALETADSSNKYGTDREICGAKISSLQNSVDNEEFINANSNLKDADDCLQSIEDSMNKKGWGLPSIPKIKFPEYGMWILIIVIIAVLIAALVVIIYLVYRKLTLLNFMKSEQTSETKETNANKNYLDKKIRDLENKLGTGNEDNTGEDITEA